MDRLELDYYYGQESEQFSFFRVPKALITDARFRDVSNNAKLLYGLMLDRMSLSAKNGWYDEENRVYIKYSINSLVEDLNCGRTTAMSLLKELVAIGLIDMVQKNGCANIIYVKNFISDRSKNQTGEKTETVARDNSCEDTGMESEPVKNTDEPKIHTSTSLESTLPPVQILDPNNTEVINTELKNTNQIDRSGMDEAEIYMQIIKENLEYDIFMQSEKWDDRDMFEELYEIICDVVCVPRKTIRIEGEDYPYSLVKSKFLKLRMDHLRYVIACMKANTTKITNIKAYLITALYNAPNTISHYYTAEVNHDLKSF